MENLKSIPTLKISITLWPEIPRQRGTEGWSYGSLTLDFQIETTATLDILLHRLLESRSLLKGYSDHWKALSLKHNPQFYLKFPDEKVHFDSSLEVLHTPAVATRNKVEKFKTLHVIVDCTSKSRRISLGNRSQVELPDRCGNGWQLVDDDHSVAVKLKGRPLPCNSCMEHEEPVR
ncbi:hypothetical protein M413DRAFT_146156 [Hebeloma cylindrosporum]|uniref:Uncharacterized protein n=1 Tax=Hebeloma cylindrosporum TaxID=76867 RepID=A0A0C3CCG5_HEBCY|nr:hypothetical protein M413DRAFT_146156 [Hebeloma cylindrosporum h7]